MSKKFVQFPYTSDGEVWVHVDHIILIEQGVDRTTEIRLSAGDSISILRPMSDVLSTLAAADSDWL